MIADVTFLGSTADSRVMKARDRNPERPADPERALPVPDTATATKLGSEHDLFALARRKFDALLPEIERLSSEIA